MCMTQVLSARGNKIYCRGTISKMCLFLQQWSLWQCWPWGRMEPWEAFEGGKYMSGYLQRGQLPCSCGWLINPQPRPSMELSVSLSSFRSPYFWTFSTWRLWEMMAVRLGCFSLGNHRCGGWPTLTIVTGGDGTREHLTIAETQHSSHLQCWQPQAGVRDQPVVTCN